jgi:DNA end-binding protein Ku
VARAIWSGSLSFGLVNIPVKLYSAVHEHDVRFHQLAPDGSRIHQKRVSEKTGKTVDYDQVRRGFETSRGKYVVFEPGELEELRPKSTRTVDIEDFVALDDIDPVYYDRTYYLAPDGPAAAKGYALLAAVMKDRKRVAIGKLVMRDKQYLAAIRPYGKALALSTMRFGDEVIEPSKIDAVPARPAPIGAREKKMAAQIVDSMSREWDPHRYHDDYEEKIRRIVQAKSKGKTIETEPEEESAQVLDLVAALRASLENPRPARGRTTRSAGKSVGKSAGKTAAKRTTKKTTKKATKRPARNGRTKRSA